MTAKHLTLALARRHEALYTRLAALAAQADALALRHPAAAAPAALRATAETLLYDSQPFLPATKGLRAAAEDLAGLAVQLGQALAALDIYEAMHTAWNPTLKCRVWTVTGDGMPVRRLRPEGGSLIRDPKEKRYFDGIKEKLLRRIDLKVETAYEQGYEDAQLNKPMREPKVRSEFDKIKT